MPDASLLAAFGIELVLGFASVWAMGALADSSALEAGLKPA
jgi:hypothetical protein